MPSNNNYEPRIVGFLCNWCAYQGADLAGTSRMAYAPNIRIVRVMCTGRIDPTFVLKAFQSGADGVIVAGCHPGDCHYSEGNYKTMRRIAMLRKLLSQMGIDDERFRLEWVSAGEGAKWAQIADEMSAALKKKGPLAWWENLKEA
jgi:F420-non-reducing hydrogenase iron-sulfur subunit